MDREEYKIQKNTFLELLKNPELPFDESSERFYTFINQLVKKEWNRGEIYDLLQDIQYNHFTLLSESILEIINEFETSLTGFCAPSSIFRFENDPENEEELGAYVRNHSLWKRKDHIDREKNFEELSQFIYRINQGYDGILQSINILSMEKVEIIITVIDKENNNQWINVKFILSKAVEFNISPKRNYCYTVLSPYGIQVSYQTPYIYIDFCPIDDLPVKPEYTLKSPLYFSCESVEWEVAPYKE